MSEICPPRGPAHAPTAAEAAQGQGPAEAVDQSAAGTDALAPAEAAPAVSREGAQTLRRGLTALRLLAEAPHGLTASEVGTRLEVHRSIAYRLLMTLVDEGFAVRDAEARYRVGAELVAIGERVRPRLRAVADQVLRDLADDTGATACLVVRDGGHAVAIAVARPHTDGIHLSYRVGSREPLDRGAGGLALLAAEGASEGEPERVTATRRAGYAITSEELTPGFHGVGVPIATGGDDGPAALTLLTPTREQAVAAAALTVAAAGRIASRLRA